MTENFLEKKFINLDIKNKTPISIYSSCIKNLNCNIKLIILQEIFGVNHSIKNSCDNFARYGLAVFAPALFHRLKKNVALGYTKEEKQQGLLFMHQLPKEDIFIDIQSLLESFSSNNKIFILGYCFGGSLAWQCATKFPHINGVICYYGSDIINHIDKKALCPTLMHFGEEDSIISRSAIHNIQTTLPNTIIYTYQAGHGFANPDRPEYSLTNALFAEKRTIQFIMEQIAKSEA